MTSEEFDEAPVDKFRRSVNAQARRLLNEGWYQISRRQGLLARLPEGLTGTEALVRDLGERRLINAWARVLLLGERIAGDYWLRIYATGICTIKVDSYVMSEFKRLGGGPYKGLLK